MWEPFLWLALLVGGWRWLLARRRPHAAGPLPDIGDAPEHAEPIVTPRLDDNGLVTYSMVLPRRPRRAARAAERSPVKRRRPAPIGRVLRWRPTDGS